MSSILGNNIRCSVFGESHGTAIGCVLDGLPAGEPVDMEEILRQMVRRAPGRDAVSTSRKEDDRPEILSGLFSGVTTGAPLAMTITNTNTRSGDYAGFSDTPRPGHADYTAFARYGGNSDVRGGGHFSGRLTAPLVFAGALCRQILERRGVQIGAHILEMGRVRDESIDSAGIGKETLSKLTNMPFPLINPVVEAAMREAVETARMDSDSIGGIVEAVAAGMPAGIGSPMFGGVENRLAAALFGIPAVKGVEFGDGFALAGMRGSEANDPFVYADGQVCTETNKCGGILGGITTGMPIILRTAFKPTPSITKEQCTVDLTSKKDAKISINGRHDPCIVPRAVPVVESVMAIVLLDMLTERYGYDNGQPR